MYIWNVMTKPIIIARCLDNKKNHKNKKCKIKNVISIIKEIHSTKQEEPATTTKTHDFFESWKNV